jgi:tRNA (guanine-N7-)-methyltransferase
LGFPADDAEMVSAAEIIVDPPKENELIEPARWFGSRATFELEIGTGKGGFLLSRARANPRIFFLGLEIRNKYFQFAADRMARWHIENVRMMRFDARRLVVCHLPPQCLSALHLYHPDPWPKKRHQKRRLVQTDFVAAAVRALAPGALWLVQSDHEEYFSQMTGLLSARPELRSTPWQTADASAGPDWKGTNFEIKYARAGVVIHRAAYVRKTSAKELIGDSK